VSGIIFAQAFINIIRFSVTFY